ncbi:hypothetical protein FRB90_010498 [Tulasnella sp. 427]|nr:hypothetical protein FRB90_010498 [Tulasnella sp. 427]
MLIKTSSDDTQAYSTPDNRTFSSPLLHSSLSSPANTPYSIEHMVLFDEVGKEFDRFADNFADPKNMPSNVLEQLNDNFGADGNVTQAVQHIPSYGYGIAVLHKIAGDDGKAQRAVYASNGTLRDAFDTAKTIAGVGNCAVGYPQVKEVDQETADMYAALLREKRARQMAELKLREQQESQGNA